VLEAHGVLRLHGPPHHPLYYGQLERQNREHRAWLKAFAPWLRPDNLDEMLLAMRRALNELWPRAKLGFRTPGECWGARPVIKEDRSKLRDEVVDRVLRLQHDGLDRIQAKRFAIEAALIKRGYLRIESGEGAK
jgi:hypothetical protein